MTNEQALTTHDRFAIYEQLQLHQRCIDNDASAASAQKYVDLYWPEARFTTHDVRNMTFDGPEGLKKLYDYAHSVFPIQRMFHTVGSFVIEGHDDEATVEWHWIVSWREGAVGTLSTGTYHDRFQRRNGVWKCIERVSNVDANWPYATFQEWVDREAETFRAS